MADLKFVISIMFMVMSLKTIQSRDLAAQRSKRENRIELCDATQFSNEDKVQCFCKSMFLGNISFPYRADCLITKNNIPADDDVWRSFSSIKTVDEILFSSKGEGIISYIPTLALKIMRELITITIKYGKIHTVHAYAFANSTNIQRIKLSGNEIQKLSLHAFAHHPNLTSITLDENRITEIKRNVFKDLPQLQELFVTSNNISTIHDRAFVHLGGLRNLELERNLIFVLTNETFLGLGNLTQLNLRENSLEVIGENTFAPLINLKSLILDKNNIKMLDDKAFNGASNLESISLAHNKLRELTNPRLFMGLTSLAVLDLKSNGMKVLSPEVVAPILHNFYAIGSSIGFEDNQFSCDCKLNWFLTLKNNTKNTHLQQTIDNLMCYPSAKLTEDFKKYEENEKSQEDPNPAAEVEYDYYDESTLAGRMFFIDIPSKLVPCETETAMKTETVPYLIPTLRNNLNNTIAATIAQITTVRSQHHVQHETTTASHQSSPSLRETSQSRYFPEHRISKPIPTVTSPTATTRIDTVPSFMSQTIPTLAVKHFEPTEEIVKDAFETTIRPKLRVTENTKMKKAIDSVSSHAAQEGLSRTTNSGEQTESIEKPRSSPESASHVNEQNVSGASRSISYKIFTFSIPTCLVLLSSLKLL